MFPLLILAAAIGGFAFLRNRPSVPGKVLPGGPISPSSRAMIPGHIYGVTVRTNVPAPDANPPGEAFTVVQQLIADGFDGRFRVSAKSDHEVGGPDPFVWHAQARWGTGPTLSDHAGAQYLTVSDQGAPTPGA
jgi:hypothetical protein